MQLRVFFLFILIVISSSCQFFNVDKKNNIQVLDTIIDFSSVDVSPSFKVCDSIIDKKAKTDCFRNTIHQEIFDNLSKQKIQIKKPISEIIQVQLEINNKGVVSLKKIETSILLQEAIPNLDSLITQSLLQLPKLFPAIKRGIPVTTQYQLPIQIDVK